MPGFQWSFYRLKIGTKKENRGGGSISSRSATGQIVLIFYFYY
jgi:hypothetical protein